MDRESLQPAPASRSSARTGMARERRTHATAGRVRMPAPRTPSAPVEAEQPRRVLPRDLAPVLLGNAGEDPIEKFPRLRPRGLRMREIVAPEHVLHADHVAEPE